MPLRNARIVIDGNFDQPSIFADSDGGFTITTMVTDEYALPFGDADVIAFPIDRRLWFPTSRFVRRADVGRNGTFSLRELPPGDYYLAAVDKRDEIEGITEIGNPDFLVALEGGAARLTVAEGLRVSALLRPVTLSSFP
jgi:hypothetical protein